MPGWLGIAMVVLMLLIDTVLQVQDKWAQSGNKLSWWYLIAKVIIVMLGIAIVVRESIEGDAARQELERQTAKVTELKTAIASSGSLLHPVSGPEGLQGDCIALEFGGNTVVNRGATVKAFALGPSIVKGHLREGKLVIDATVCDEQGKTIFTMENNRYHGDSRYTMEHTGTEVKVFDHDGFPVLHVRMTGPRSARLTGLIARRNGDAASFGREERLIIAKYAEWEGIRPLRNGRPGRYSSIRDLVDMRA